MYHGRDVFRSRGGACGGSCKNQRCVFAQGQAGNCDCSRLRGAGRPLLRPIERGVTDGRTILCKHQINVSLAEIAVPAHGRRQLQGIAVGHAPKGHALIGDRFAPIPCINTPVLNDDGVKTVDLHIQANLVCRNAAAPGNPDRDRPLWLTTGMTPSATALSPSYRRMVCSAEETGAFTCRVTESV